MWPFPRRKPPPPRGIDLAGHYISEDELCTSALITGGVGRGKSVASERFLKPLVARSPILAACVKPDEARRYLRICRDIGAERRLRIVEPGSPWKLNLLEYLVNAPGGGPLAAVQHLTRLNDVALRAEAGGNKGETFWISWFEAALLAAIDLCILADEPLNLETVYDVLSSSPADTEIAASEDVYRTGLCGRLLGKTRDRYRAGIIPTDDHRRCRRVADVFLKELPAVGPKARAAILSMNNNLLGRFLVEPFHDAFCRESTLTPELIERERLIVVLNFPVLIHGIQGRLLQLAWIMNCQAHCLRRDPQTVDRPFVVARDEAGYVLSPDWDAQVQVVARSQKLMHIDIVQDLDVLQACLGGSPKSRHEALAFSANHMIKLMFGNTNEATNEHFSKVIGDRKEFLFGGSSGKEPSGDFIDEILGVSGRHSYQEHYEPHVRPGDFSRLDVGQAYLHAGGRTLENGSAHAFLDFRRR